MIHPTGEVRNTLTACGWPNDLTLDDVEVIESMFSVETPTGEWASRVVVEADAAMPRTTGVAYLDDGYNIVGIGRTDTTIAGRQTNLVLTDLNRSDACFAMRAFDQGYERVRPMGLPPVALVSPRDLLAPVLVDGITAAASAEIPPGARVFVEVDEDDPSVVYDVWAVTPSTDDGGLGIWRRNDGQWMDDPGWLSVLQGDEPPNLLYLPSTSKILPDLLKQVDAATAGKPFEALTASLVMFPEVYTDLLPLIARGNRAGLKKAAGVGKGGNPEVLRAYWAEGEGAAKIRWGTGGDWYRCRKQLTKYMGVRAKGYCFAGECEFITRDGLMTFADAVGTKQLVLTQRPVLGAGVLDGPMTEGYWVEAPIVSFGEQRLLRVTVSRGGVQKVIRATPEHRWLVSQNGRNVRRFDLEQVTTESLQPGMVFPTLYAEQDVDLHPSPDGIRAGIVFGDGSRRRPRHASDVSLWGEKEELLRYFDGYRKGAQKQTASGVLGTRVSGLPSAYKDKPSLSEDRSFLYGWLAGYFATDGTLGEVGSTPVLYSTVRENLEHAQDVANILGIPTGTIGVSRGDGYRDGGHDVYRMTFLRWGLPIGFLLRRSHRERFVPTKKTSGRWTVVSVEDQGEAEEVFCAVVPETEMFALSDNIVSQNCNLLHKRVLGYYPSTHAKMIRDAKGGGHVASAAPLAGGGSGSWKWQLRDRLGQWMDMNSPVQWMERGRPLHGYVVDSPKDGVATVQLAGVNARKDVPTSRLTATGLPPGAGDVLPSEKPTLPKIPKNLSSLSDKQVQELYWATRDHPNAPLRSFLHVAWELQKRKIELDPHVYPSGEIFASGAPGLLHG